MLQSICVSCAKVFQARLGQPLPAQCWDCVNRGFGDSTLVRGSATEASEEQLEAAAVLAMARMDIESTRAQLAAANEAKEKAEQKAATAIQDFIHGRDKLCLVCGAKEPCHLKDTSTPPCTFEPSPIELLQIHRDLRAKVEKAERERDEAVAALDANWVTHQRVARAESDNARLRERVDELEGVFSKLSGGVDMKGRSPVVMPVKDFLAQMDAPKGGEA